MVINEWDAQAEHLYTRFRSGEISPEEMAAELPPLWRLRSDRDPLNNAAAWRAMVEHAGYFNWRPGEALRRPACRPRRRHRLFRGATPRRRRGISWTSNPAIARWFADYRQPPGEDGQALVWVAVVSPQQVLGYLHDEREFLVDATNVDVRPWTGRDAGIGFQGRRWIAENLYW